MNYPGNPINAGSQISTVEIIQQQLNNLGFGPLVVDGGYGPKTSAVVTAFQKANQLQADGVVGPHTWSVLFPQPQPASGLAGLALQMITGQLGQEEVPHGSNSGPMVSKYLAAVGLGPGYPWCQSLVYWSYQQAASQAGAPNPVVKTGGVLNCWDQTAPGSRITAASALANPALILPGYQMILDFGGGEGHTGLVESLAGHTLTTIEGNSNTTGSRDGEMVVRQTKRTLNDKDLKGFIRY